MSRAHLTTQFGDNQQTIMVQHLAADIGEIHATPAYSVGFELDIRGKAAQPVIV
ncbi:hypothetical protein D3C80_1969040 [compost metagenome]